MKNADSLSVCCSLALYRCGRVQLSILMATRRPTHAGSWYTADTNQLASELSAWLRDAGQPAEVTGTTRAIIAPHAGYSYSGPTAAWAYKHMARVKESVRRVFLLGPSHNLYSPKCLLSSCSEYATPLGSIKIDDTIYDELAASNLFDEMQLSVDEREHSLEMHLPYIMHVMAGVDFTLVPIMVGALSESAEQRYGQLLAPYLADPQNLFVISSDFCHWGDRFNYTPYDARHGEICQYIEALDRNGMAFIERIDAQGFAKYQREYNNTICGRHPIAVLLNSLLACADGVSGSQIRHELKFIRYAQSSPCRRLDDSSVSYASAVITAAT